MACQKLTLKKYTERPSPPYHAGECKDKILEGNDKKMYKSVGDKKGIYKWKLVGSKTKKNKGGIRYTTVNNGANYWIVEDFPKEKRVVIYKNNAEEVKVTEMKYLELWPSSPLTKGDKKFADTWKKGNTVLIQKSKDTFIIVFMDIIEFKIEPGDNPLKFMSPIGNSDSPYPYLIGKDNIYFIYETPEFFKSVPKDEIDLNDDVISQFLSMNDFKDKPLVTRNKIKAKIVFSPCDCRWIGTDCGKKCSGKKI